MVQGTKCSYHPLRAANSFEQWDPTDQGTQQGYQHSTAPVSQWPTSDRWEPPKLSGCWLSTWVPRWRDREQYQLYVVHVVSSTYLTGW
jgi:hypothetical protein